ncbi:MAG: efflux RND transporter periplasmic adaptor subunit [Magnetococcus sp. DMHC-6]
MYIFFSFQLLFIIFLGTLSVHAEEPVLVSTQPISEIIRYPNASATALVVSLNDTLLSSEVSGTIEKISVQVGQRVQTGQELLQLDNWEYRLQRDQAKSALDRLQAQLELVRKQYNRSAQLRQEGHASAELLEQRQSELTALQAQLIEQESILKAAQTRLNKSLLKAPFTGIVSQRLAQIGSWAAPGLPLIHLVDTEELELIAQVGSSEAKRLTGKEVWHFYWEGENYPLQLRIILPLEDPETKTRQARFLFSGAKPPPGANGQLQWQTTRPYLPPSVLVQRDGVLGIFLAHSGQALFHPLPDAQEGRAVPLLELPTEEIILSGREGLSHGTPIRITASP